MPAPSDEILRAILQSATDYAIIATDLDGNVTTWNEGACAILGWTEDEIVGKSAAEIFIAEDVAAGVPAEEMSRATTTGKAADERWHRRKDGTRFWANGAMMPLLADTGEPIGFLKILRDRTQERLTQQALQASEDRFQFAIGAAGGVGAWDWDIKANRVYADERFARYHSVDPEEAASGLPIESFLLSVHAEDRDRVVQAVERSLNQAADYVEEYRLIQKDGSTVWAFARGRIYLDETNRPARFLGVVTDITGRKRTEVRQAAILELGIHLRELTDTAAIACAAAKLVGQTINAARAGYGSIDHDGQLVTIERDWTNDAVPSVEGVHRFSDFGSYIEDLKRGDLVVIPDVNEDARTSASAASFVPFLTRALINVPLLEHGRLSGVFLVHDREPRSWSRDETDFIHAVADLTWEAFQRARTEARQRLVMHEMQHRLKNTLATVQAIVSQSLRTAATPADARQAISQRLRVLAQAHDTLTRTNWAAAPITEIVEETIAVHRAAPDRIRTQGPSLLLGAKPALGLTLALHELCTNAVKYGALSTEEGHVEINWRIEDHGGGDSFHIDWRESNGPPVAPRDRRGFGSTLIERALSEVSAKTELLFEPSGVTWQLDAPLSAVVDQG